MICATLRESAKNAARYAKFGAPGIGTFRGQTAVVVGDDLNGGDYVAFVISAGQVYEFVNGVCVKLHRVHTTNDHLCEMIETHLEPKSPRALVPASYWREFEMLSERVALAFECRAIATFFGVYNNDEMAFVARPESCPF
jgi:hypothetical protein